FTTWSRRRLVAIHEGLIQHHGESPYDARWFERPDHADRITTRIEISRFLWARTKALLAHATQVDPTEAFWFGLSDDQLAEIYPYEDWILARSTVGPMPGRDAECDLFDGVAGPCSPASWSARRTSGSTGLTTPTSCSHPR